MARSRARRHPRQQGSREEPDVRLPDPDQRLLHDVRLPDRRRGMEWQCAELGLRCLRSREVPRQACAGKAPREQPRMGADLLRRPGRTGL